MHLVLIVSFLLIWPDRRSARTCEKSVEGIQSGMRDLERGLGILGCLGMEKYVVFNSPSWWGNDVEGYAASGYLPEEYNTSFKSVES